MVSVVGVFEREAIPLLAKEARNVALKAVMIPRWEWS